MLKFALVFVVLICLNAPAFGQTTAVDWDNRGNELEAEGRYDEAIQAYNRAIEIDPQDKLGYNLKAQLLVKLGRAREADIVYAEIEEVEDAGDTSIIDHGMASTVDASNKSIINRSYEFSSNDSKAYSWVSLKNVQGGSTLWWIWFSPDGSNLYTDKMQIPMPESGTVWSIFNASSHMDIAGNYAANLPGDWLIEVHLNGDTILAEYFSISEDWQSKSTESQYLYNQENSNGYANDYLNNLNLQGKKDEAINKGNRLEAEGRYEEAIRFYDEAINLDPNNWNNWMTFNSKGDALSKLGRYEEAIEAYSKAIELTPENPISYGRKGAALKALGRTDESDIAYATARELGDYSAWIPKTNATSINLTSLFQIEILDHSMASNVDESTSNVITRSEAFSEKDSKIYSWLSLGHVLGAEVDWHWYSPDGNPYKTGRVEVPRNHSGGFWPVYYVWYPLDIASIPTESYMSGEWFVDIYINGKKRLTEKFALNIDSETATVNPSSTNGPGTSHGTFTVLDHAIASEIDEATDKPFTTARTEEIKDTLMAYSWLQLGNIGVARIEWDWYGGEGYEITHTYEIPPNPKGGYYEYYNVWDSLNIPGMLQDFEIGESNEWTSRRSAEMEGDSYYSTNPTPDPRGEWTVDVYVNDQWLLQEEFAVVSG